MATAKNDIFKDLIGILLAGLIIVGGYVIFLVAFPETTSNDSYTDLEATGPAETGRTEDKFNLNNNGQTSRNLATPDKTPSYGFAPSGWDNKFNYPPERAKHNTPQK